MVRLSKEMKDYVKGTSKKGYTKETRSTYDKRLLQYATVGIKDLTFLAEELTEQMQAQVFTDWNLKQLFRALFQVGDSSGGITEEKRLRILRLCNCALDEIKTRRNGPVIAPKAWKVLKETASSDYHEEVYGTKVIQAIQIEGAVFIPKEETKL
jgi:hypothetical protein